MSDNKELEMLQDGTKVSPETDDMGSIHVMMRSCPLSQDLRLPKYPVCTA